MKLGNNKGPLKHFDSQGIQWNPLHFDINIIHVVFRPGYHVTY